jgi:hypothetical protein
MGVNSRFRLVFSRVWVNDLRTVRQTLHQSKYLKKMKKSEKSACFIAKFFVA